MQLTDIFQGLGQDATAQLLRTISLGKLKTFQLYERLKTRLHVSKLNTEALRKVAPRCWERLTGERDEEFATELAQAILVSHMDMIKAVLDFLEIPHDDGFFPKDLDTAKYLHGDWRERAYDKFKDAYPRPLLLFYLNHLGWESAGATDMFLPQSEAAPA